MGSNLPNRKPDWLKVKANTGNTNKDVMKLLRSLHLHTVCEEAACPNCGECFGRRTATFLIMGKHCTRNCRFCCVEKNSPLPLDDNEPQNLAEAVRQLRLKHVVITSVTRDDLPDGGAKHFANVINTIKSYCDVNPPVIEVLIPDFKGDLHALNTVVDAQPDIINHNIETIHRLYLEIRPEADYNRSLALISNVKALNNMMTTKSGIMVGLGETFDEVINVMSDLLAAGCDLLTIGQYLSPSKLHYPVIEYVQPDIFTQYKKIGEEMGFKFVSSGPLVRSSYLADQAYEHIK